MKQQPNPKLLIAGAVGILVIIILAVVMLGGSKSPTSNSTQNQTSSNVPDVNPPADAIAVAQAYAQASQDSVGYDMSSPTAWINAVKPLSTPAWFAKLQPPPNSPTGSESAQYQLAHSNKWRVKATISGCHWDLEAGRPTSTQGVIYCDLTDQTVDASGNVVPSNKLPFGWTGTGKQIPITYSLVKQNGKWLVDDDASGEG